MLGGAKAPPSVLCRTALNTMLTDDDLDRAARHLVERYGDSAEDKARHYAEILLKAGNDDAATIWQKIANAIKTLRSSRGL